MTSCVISSQTLRSGLGREELAERHDADEAPLLVDGVEVGDGRDLGVDLPEVRHRLGDRPVGADLHEPVGHETARGARAPRRGGPRAAAASFADIRFSTGRRRSSGRKERRRAESSGSSESRAWAILDGREARQRHPEDAAPEVGEDPAELVLVELLEDGDPVFPRDRREEVGDVGRVELEQPLAQRRRVVADDLEDVGAEELSDPHAGRV